MSYGTSSGNPGPSSRVDMQHVQRALYSLLERLHWSYVALWSFNPQSRILEWTAGHFTGNSNAAVWSIQLFNMQKTCTFTPGQGSVGVAFAEQRSIWRNGPSVRLSAGDEVQARILEHARIETAVYIPSAETVLELGTSLSVAENVHHMNQICVVMWEDILPALGRAQAPPQVSQSPLAPLLSHASHEFPNQDFAPNEPTRGTPSLNIDDMFLQHPNEDEELGITSSVPTEPTWLSSATTSRLTDLLQLPNSQALPVSAANQQYLRMFQDYRSLSGTTSSSLSSLEDTSVRLSVDSPGESISFMAPSTSQRHKSHKHASSSARRETPSHSPELQLVGTTGIPGPAPHLHDVQHLVRQMLGSQVSWPQITHIDPSLGLPSAFKIWPELTQFLRRRERSTNQWLLRRSFEILRQNRNLQQSNQPLQAAPVPKREEPRRGQPSSSPEDIQGGPSRVRGRIRRVGTPGSGSGEAHMLAERLRRKRIKENFADLRNIVPIISKNDKASILGDAIIYIKDLEAQIQAAQADRAEMRRRYETLQSSHHELQDRNKQLEAALVAATSSGGPSSTLPPP